MRRRWAATIGAAVAVALVAAVLLVPVEVRHSAPFGFRLTLDDERGIAVMSGRVRPNYDDFNRLDLDLRAYIVASDYDLAITIRPDRRGAAAIRTIPLSVRGADIRHNKDPLQDPFLTVRFPPIPDSAGKRYSVLVQTGPRNRDDIITLWSMKSYSAVSGRAVVGAILDDPPGDVAPTVLRLVLGALLAGFAAAVGWLTAGLLSLIAAGRPVRLHD
ncbi:MAG: hypothetical protein AVDCRST_MAG73-3959 [uncultured Thermomicrobiales bacterium]|uniref:Uncharacterized protein n=1 Tax=uncultured Thermomicrobiales bacterium TaxID=1645740 RepID=A0A6J4UYL4_9BACT|nr:MAG: hypothetical protein AVDCRST_MAG73-3959 [uncultured Thermomicrobiales bacterium]